MYFTILTFTVVIVWIGLSIYRNFNPVTPLDMTAVTPIDGTFDFETISRLKSRKAIPVDFTEQFTSSSSAIQTPTVESTPSALLETLPPVISTSSGIIASPSGNL